MQTNKQTGGQTMHVDTSCPYQRPDMTEWARCRCVPAVLSPGKRSQDKPDSRPGGILVRGGALLYTERRPHTAAPAKAKMSRAVNSCHITQPANVMSSSDVTLRPSEYKNSEGYEKSLQVAALFRQRQAALINTLMFPLLFTGTAVHYVYDTERHVCEWSSKRSWRDGD